MKTVIKGVYAPSEEEAEFLYPISELVKVKRQEKMCMLQDWANAQ